MTPELFFEILEMVRAMAADFGCSPELVHHKRDGALVVQLGWGDADFSTKTLFVDLREWQSEGPLLK
jgi:hypothetical protein